MAEKLVAKRFDGKGEWFLVFFDPQTPRVQYWIVQSNSGRMLSVIKQLGVHDYFDDPDLTCGGPLPLGMRSFSAAFYTRWVMITSDIQVFTLDPPQDDNQGAVMRAPSDSTPSGPPDCSYQASYDRLMNNPKFNLMVQKAHMNAWTKGGWAIQGQVQDWVESEMQACERQSFHK